MNTTLTTKRNVNNLWWDNVFLNDWFPKITTNDLFITFDDYFRVDIKDKPNCVEVTAELPGVSKENVNVSVENGVLTIEANYQEEQIEEGEKYIRRERKSGTRKRSFKLREDLDDNSIHATMSDGILKITINKNEKSKIKRIPVE